MERRALQGVLAALSLIPLLGLCLIWLDGPRYFLGDDGITVPLMLDNQLRYLAGVYFGTVTLALWWAISRIEACSEVITIVAVGVFLGGVGRLISIASVGMPGDPSLIMGLVLELIVAPLLVLWQRRVARSAQLRED